MQLFGILARDCLRHCLLCSFLCFFALCFQKSITVSTEITGSQVLDSSTFKTYLYNFPFVSFVTCILRRAPPRTWILGIRVDANFNHFILKLKACSTWILNPMNTALLIYVEETNESVQKSVLLDFLLPV